MPHLVVSKPMTDLCKLCTIETISPIWTELARIPVKHQQHSIAKLELLFKLWKDLKRLRERKTPTQLEKVNQFSSGLDDLFDIAHADAMKLITLKEDKDFLTAQREPGRRGFRSSVDHQTSRKEDRLRERKAAQQKRQAQAEDDREALIGDERTNQCDIF